MFDDPPTAVEIPQGAVRVHTMCGLPTNLCLALGCISVGCLFIAKSWWLLPVLGLAWGFLRYHSRRDVHFLSVWLGHLTLQPHYRP